MTMYHRFTGSIPAPRVYSTLTGTFEPTGTNIYQCEDCGFWLSDKMSPSDIQEHDRQCRLVTEEEFQAKKGDYS